MIKIHSKQKFAIPNKLLYEINWQKNITTNVIMCGNFCSFVALYAMFISNISSEFSVRIFDIYFAIPLCRTLKFDLILQKKNKTSLSLHFLHHVLKQQEFTHSLSYKVCPYQTWIFIDPLYFWYLSFCHSSWSTSL